MKHNTQIIDRPESKITRKRSLAPLNVVNETTKKSSFSNFEDDYQTRCTKGADNISKTIENSLKNTSVREKASMLAIRARESYIFTKGLVSAMIAKQGGVK